MVYGELQTSGLGASIAVGDDPYVRAGLCTYRVVPRIEVAGGNISDYRDSIRHIDVDGGGAVAAVDVGHGHGLRARFGEGEPPHGHRQVLRADYGIDLHRVRVMHRHVRRHDTVATVLILQRLFIHARRCVGFPIPHKAVANGSVKRCDVRRVDGKRQRHNTVAPLLIGKFLHISS